MIGIHSEKPSVTYAKDQLFMNIHIWKYNQQLTKYQSVPLVLPPRLSPKPNHTAMEWQEKSNPIVELVFPLITSLWHQ